MYQHIPQESLPKIRTKKDTGQGFYGQTVYFHPYNLETQKCFISILYVLLFRHPAK